MPIKSLVDSHRAGAGLPRIARLYKGAPKPENGRQPGKDLNHFRIEFELQYADLSAIWTELYGDKPTEFAGIMLAGNTVDDVYDFWYEDWTATTLLHRCDGEEQHKWWNKEAAMYQTSRIACAKDGQQPCACKMIGRLEFFIPEFVDATGVLGKISATTHSTSDVLTTYKYLRDMQALYKGLSGVPFVFGRAPRTMSVPNPKKAGERMNVTKSLFYLHVTADFTRQRLLPAMAATLELPAGTAPALPSGEDTPPTVRMGAGKDRRIGLAEDEWLKDSTARKNFLGYAADKFDFDEDEVLIALQNATDSDAVRLVDWRGTKALAIGALVAAHVEYDAGAAEALTIHLRLDPSIWEATKQICERVETANADEAPEASFDMGTGGTVEE